MENTSSAFDDFGGYYAVIVDGIEVARYAPGNFWSDFITYAGDEVSYKWVEAN